MKILQNKLITNHKNSNCILSMIFFMATTTETAAKATAAFTIFMQAIASVNTIYDYSHVQPDTEMTAAAATAETWAKTLYDLSKNPVIAQQSPKIPTKIETPPIQPPPYSSTAATLKASSTLNPFHLSKDTATMTQPKARFAVNFALATAEGDCKSLTAAWGDVDPNIFYICDIQTKKSLQLRCPKGKGFFLGLGYSGCIPYEQWPACVSSGHQVAVCDSEHMQQPWESKNPNKFYVCLKETIEPTIVNCEPGKGFVHATVTTGVGSGGDGTRIGAVGAHTTSEIVGCTKWEKWRIYMHCNDYI